MYSARTRAHYAQASEHHGSGFLKMTLTCICTIDWLLLLVFNIFKPLTLLSYCISIFGPIETTPWECSYNGIIEDMICSANFYSQNVCIVRIHCWIIRTDEQTERFVFLKICTCRHFKYTTFTIIWFCSREPHQAWILVIIKLIESGSSFNEERQRLKPRCGHDRSMM